jgi:hypothetical protein
MTMAGKQIDVGGTDGGGVEHHGGENRGSFAISPGLPLSTSSHSFLPPQKQPLYETV